MAKIGMMWRWLAACALLMASALAFATGDAEQSASESFSYAVSSLGWNPGTGYARRILQEF